MSTIKKKPHNEGERERDGGEEEILASLKLENMHNPCEKFLSNM